MDGKSFAKLCKDCNLIDNITLWPSDPDLVFARVVPKGQRRMDMQQFEEALGLVAEKKGVDPDSVCQAIIDAGGPIMRATEAFASRLHDDKSTYSGTHAHRASQLGREGKLCTPRNGYAKQFVDQDAVESEVLSPPVPEREGLRGQRSIDVSEF